MGPISHAPGDGVNFADEEYVRLYTSNSVTWKALGWQGQTVLMHLLRCFDNSGGFEFGRRTPAKAIVIATGLPDEVVESGLESILAEEIWRLEDTQIFWPKYVDAQTCRRSDRYRKRAERDRSSRQRDQKSPERDNCPKPVQVGHAPSRNVTPRRGGAGRGEASESSSLKRKEEQNPDPSPAKAVTDFYFKIFEEKRGTKPVFGGAEGTAVKNLLKKLNGDAEKATSIISNAFNSWGSDTRTILEIAHNPSKWVSATLSLAPTQQPAAESQVW